MHESEKWKSSCSVVSDSGWSSSLKCFQICACLLASHGSRIIQCDQMRENTLKSVKYHTCVLLSMKARIRMWWQGGNKSAVPVLQFLYCSPAQLKASLPLRIPALYTTGWPCLSSNNNKITCSVPGNFPSFRHCARYYMCIVSFNLRNNLIKMRLQIPILQMKRQAGSATWFIWKWKLDHENEGTATGFSQITTKLF